MEFVFLPTWANIVAIIAILGIIGSAFLPKFENITKTLSVSAKTAYYTTAMSVVVALGAIFCFLSHVTVGGSLLIVYGVIAGIGVIACMFACMEEPIKGALCVGAVVAIAIMFATLAFANVAFAAIWVTVLGLTLFVGHMLFKEK
ncbi:MAG: hypothetical protein J6N49_04665 [Alphaproteobacteria bacterium]|nr:hypothetical protein [Alphaproteobacteria bacterium]